MSVSIHPVAMMTCCVACVISAVSQEDLTEFQRRVRDRFCVTKYVKHELPIYEHDVAACQNDCCGCPLIASTGLLIWRSFFN